MQRRTRSNHRNFVWGVTGKGKDEPVRVEKAFPAVVSKTKFRRVMRLMQTRAPKVVHPRRVGSTSWPPGWSWSL